MFKLGLQKINRKIDLEWKEIDNKYGLDRDCARQYVKRRRKKEGYFKDKIDNSRYRILSLADLHIPFYNRERVLNIIKQHKDEFDEIILNGDILDVKPLSKFAKEKITLIEEELIEGHNLLRNIRRITDKKIILVRGNHENRLSAFIANNCLEISSLVNEDILDMLANGFTVYEKMNKKKKHYRSFKNVIYANEFYYKVGKTVFTHPLNFSQVDGKIAVLSANYFKQMFEDVDCVVVAHTHKICNILSGSSGIYSYEQGCICDEMNYAKRGNLNLKRQRNGYIMVVQDIEGNLMVNETKQYVLD